MNVCQAFQQPLRKQCEAVIAIFGGKFGTQLNHVIAQDALNPTVNAVFQPHHGRGLHGLVKRQRQGATAHRSAFVFEHEAFESFVSFFQHVNGQAVFEINVGRLSGCALAKTGATMVGMPFKVQRIVQLHQHIGFTRASHAAQHQQIALCNGIVEGLNQEGTQRFIAAGDARVIDSGLVLEPLLDDLRTHATAKTIQAPFRVGPRKICPRLQSLGLGRTRNQLMPQYHRRLLALLLVTRTHAFAFMVSHERQIDHAGECTLVKFNRRAGVHHRPIIDEQIAQVGYVMSHHETSTAYVCRSTNWPIG